MVAAVAVAVAVALAAVALAAVAVAVALAEVALAALAALAAAAVALAAQLWRRERGRRVGWWRGRRWRFGRRCGQWRRERQRFGRCFGWWRDRRWRFGRRCGQWQRERQCFGRGRGPWRWPRAAAPRVGGRRRALRAPARAQPALARVLAPVEGAAAAPLDPAPRCCRQRWRFRSGRCRHFERRTSWPLAWRYS